MLPLEIKFKWTHLWSDRCRGRVIRVIGFGAEGLGFESHSGSDWKTVTVHPTVKRYLTIVREFKASGGERRGLDTPFHMSLVVRKPVFGVSDQVRHKPGCKTTEDG